ncbi:hypothetical protein JCM24511_02526 [Saitozyma sp. JCM 24511]|nr:hypothetical protein JCM24511_02526 [Saitozyma sp. JCM 24511]
MVWWRVTEARDGSKARDGMRRKQKQIDVRGRWDKHREEGEGWDAKEADHYPGPMSGEAEGARRVM